MAIDVEAASEVAVREELSRRRLLDFARAVYPKWSSPRHIEYIARLLERVERGELRRLCVSVPVRSGKSVLCSQIFPAWYLGRHPTEPVILSSHAESLAVSFSRQARNIVAGDDWPFANVEMSSDSTSVQRWNTTAGGGMYAIGTGGAVTGRGFSLGICDDPIHDALSQAERDSAWEWFTTVFVPRAEPGAAIVVVAARFAGDDLVGRLMESDYASEWTFVSLPAIAGENDPLGREVGAPIWPDRMSLAELNDRKAMMGSAAFSAQFQQNPLPAGSRLFPAASLDHRYDKLPEKRIDTPMSEMPVFYGARREDIAPLVVMAADTAWRAGPSADRTAIVTVFCDGTHFFIADVFADRISYENLKSVAEAQYAKWRASHFFVEDVGSGIGLQADLKRTSTIPVIPVKTGGLSKESRAEQVVGLFEAGRVLFPRRASWLENALDEFRRFPGGSTAKDDVVDATVYAIAQADRILQSQRGQWEMRKRLGPGSSWMSR